MIVGKRSRLCDVMDADAMMMMMIQTRRGMQSENEELYVRVMERDGGPWHMKCVKHVPSSEQRYEYGGAESRTTINQIVLSGYECEGQTSSARGRAIRSRLGRAP